MKAYILSKVYDQNLESFHIFLLWGFTCRKSLHQCLEGFHVIHGCQSSNEKKVLLSHICLVFLINVALTGFYRHFGSITHEKGCFH